MKRWIPVFTIFVAVIVVFFVLNQLGLFRTMSGEELLGSFEVTDVKTKWVKKYYQPWPPKLILVPSISFKVKNISDKPLKYINFNANFRFQDDNENLGDCFLAAIRNEPVMPGEVSDEISLVSNYGMDGTNKAHFIDNPHWRIVICKLFATSRGSQFIELGEFTISREIDFEEPEDVGLPEKKAPVKKKQP